MAHQWWGKKSQLNYFVVWYPNNVNRGVNYLHKRKRCLFLYCTFFSLRLFLDRALALNRASVKCWCHGWSFSIGWTKVWKGLSTSSLVFGGQSCKFSIDKATLASWNRSWPQQFLLKVPSIGPTPNTKSQRLRWVVLHTHSVSNASVLLYGVQI